MKVDDEGKIDGLFTELKAMEKKDMDVKFAEYAGLHSTCPSGKKGGDLGSFGPGMMVKPFNDAVFEGKVGDLLKVQTQFGFHLILITELDTAKNNQDEKDL